MATVVKPTLDWLQGVHGIGEWERLVTLDWMSEVCGNMALSRRTFHLSVAFFDVLVRGETPVTRREAQAAAVAALVVASRHTDSSGVLINELIKLTDGGATGANVQRWQRLLVEKGGWHLPVVSTVLDALPEHTVSSWNHATAAVLLGATAWVSPADCAGSNCPHAGLSSRWAIIELVALDTVRLGDALTERLGLDDQLLSLHVHLPVMKYMYRR